MATYSPAAPGSEFVADAVNKVFEEGARADFSCVISLTYDYVMVYPNPKYYQGFNTPLAR